MTADVPTTRAISDEAVSRARRALRAIRLEVVPGIADDLTVIVEAAFTALAQSSDEAALKVAVAAAGPWACCDHCADDDVHDVDLNGHDIPCQSCVYDEVIRRAALAKSSGRGADHAREDLARAWDEGRNAGAADSAVIIGWGVKGAPDDERPESTPNPYRADELTGR